MLQYAQLIETVNCLLEIKSETNLIFKSPSASLFTRAQGGLLFNLLFHDRTRKRTFKQKSTDGKFPHRWGRTAFTTTWKQTPSHTHVGDALTSSLGGAAAWVEIGMRSSIGAD